MLTTAAVTITITITSTTTVPRYHKLRKRTQQPSANLILTVSISSNPVGCRARAEDQRGGR